jgi:hypothetical protein
MIEVLCIMGKGRWVHNVKALKCSREPNRHSFVFLRSGLITYCTDYLLSSFVLQVLVFIVKYFSVLPQLFKLISVRMKSPTTEDG